MSAKAGHPSRVECGRGLFYSRDSSGLNDQTPGQYVEWALRRAAELNVEFTGSAQAIEALIRKGQHHSGDIFFDNAVAGNRLSRPGLDALKAEILADRNVSHVFIPRRDRLARPDDAIHGVELENELRDSGVFLIYMNLTLRPLLRGRRQEMGEVLSAMLDFHQSGHFRDELAEKMIYAQLQLSRKGFSAGGRAPYGFRRNLITEDGVVIRQLEDGEIVRRRGHHVVLLPGPESELEVIRRIFNLLETIPASRIAKLFNSEGIPSPDSGRIRTDNRTPHRVSGLWHPTTITGIARHKLNRALVTYGRRSMGDRRRMTPEGPRPVEPADFRRDQHPKVVQNPFHKQILAAANGECVVPVEQFEKVQEILDARAGTQRGKPRSRDPDQNPLGGRIFDMACGWPMYRAPYKDSFRYTCGSYLQSQAKNCKHNHLSGPEATKFALATIRQRLLRPEFLKMLAGKIQARAEEGSSQKEVVAECASLQLKLDRLIADLEKAQSNMALASSPVTLRAMEEVFSDLVARRDRTEQELSALRRQSKDQPQAAMIVEEALDHLRRLPSLADDPTNLAAIGELFRHINLQLFVRFRAEKKTERILQRLAGGVVTMGSAPAPIQKYSGATSRLALKKDKARNDKSPQSCGQTDDPPEDVDESSRNENRDDKIRTCDFLLPKQDRDCRSDRFNGVHRKPLGKRYSADRYSKIGQ